MRPMPSMAGFSVTLPLAAWERQAGMDLVHCERRQESSSFRGNILRCNHISQTL
jgi:hypothetical protein